MGKVRTPDERAKIKAGRLIEKAMRMPINEVILKVNDGIIPLDPILSNIKLKVDELKKKKEGLKDGR